MTESPEYASFFELTDQFLNLSKESKEALSSVLKRLALEKGHVLVQVGSICKHIYFIEKGLTRTFYFKDGKDVTDWISAEGSFAVSLISFLTKSPDRRGIELLEPSVIWRLSHHDLEDLYMKYHDIERLGRLLVSAGMIQMQQRFDDLHFATALERYKKLMNTTPTLIHRVPLGMIASYLGITQETLSRIRAQI